MTRSDREREREGGGGGVGRIGKGVKETGHTSLVDIATSFLLAIFLFGEFSSAPGR